MSLLLDSSVLNSVIYGIVGYHLREVAKVANGNCSCFFYRLKYPIKFYDYGRRE